MATFINFKELRARLDFARVLTHYGVQHISIRKGQLTARCPIPSHLGTNQKASFSADISRGIWQCFGCNTSGNVLDFAVRMEGRDPENGADVRRVALKLAGVFTGRGDVTQVLNNSEDGAVPEALVNTPLDFTLKSLDSAHPVFQEAGLRPNTVAQFGLGYCSKGLLSGRIAFPLHNEIGELIGYAGRVRQLHANEPEVPTFLFPGERTKGVHRYRFDSTRLVYNAHRITDVPRKTLIVTEDLSLVWHLWEAGADAVGIPNAIHDVSQLQAQILGKLVVDGGLLFVDRLHGSDSRRL